MAIEEGGSAPYAPPKTVIALLERFRQRGFTTPFSLDVLVRMGVTESLAPRTLQALRLLDLVEEDGSPSEEFVGLQRATSDEFQGRLAAVIRNAYAPVFAFADPAKDPRERVRDAFRGFTPVSQQERMVMLFLRLCAYAGIIDDSAPSQASNRKTAGKSDSPRRRGRPPKKTRPEPSAPSSKATPGDPSIFQVTVEDIAAIGDDFDEVWAALGKVAKARARGKVSGSKPEENDAEKTGGD